MLFFKRAVRIVLEVESYRSDFDFVDFIENKCWY
jgi:hypothetical protein